MEKIIVQNLITGCFYLPSGLRLLVSHDLELALLSRLVEEKTWCSYVVTWHQELKWHEDVLVSEEMRYTGRLQRGGNAGCKPVCVSYLCLKQNLFFCWVESPARLKLNSEDWKVLVVFSTGEKIHYRSSRAVL